MGKNPGDALLGQEIGSIKPQDKKLQPHSCVDPARELRPFPEHLDTLFALACHLGPGKGE